MRKLLLLASISAALCISLSGCGEIVPVWVGEVDLKGEYTLYYNYPQEFQIEIPEQPEGTDDYRLELEVTFDIGGIGRANLPLILILEGKAIPPTEYPIDIPLKEDGEWLGVPKDYEVDHQISSTVIPSLKLEPGSYSLKVYANDEKQEKIYGIVRIAARLFQNEAAAPTE